MLPTYQLVLCGSSGQQSFDQRWSFTLKRVVSFLFEVVLCWLSAFQARMLKQMQKMFQQLRFTGWSSAVGSLLYHEIILAVHNNKRVAHMPQQQTTAEAAADQNRLEITHSIAR